jgi:hypothetical protein
MFYKIQKMNYLIKNIAFVCFIPFVVNCSGQTTVTVFTKIPAAELRKDFTYMTDTLKKIHAGLYRYQQKQTLDMLFDSCRNSIKDSMTIADFYALTRFAVSCIKDGHSNCRLPDGVMNDYFNSVKVFPAMVLFIHNKPYILCCKQNDSLSQTELISVDGHNMDTVIRRLFTYIPSDGNIDSRKNWEMPEQFQLLYGSLYGFNQHFTVRYKSRQGDIRSVVLYAENIKDILCADPFPRPTRYLELSFPSNGIALLTIKSFLDEFLRSTGENFAGFLDSTFRVLKENKISKLIIDVRSNQGGNDGNGWLLYSYLTAKPFMYYASKETVSEIFSPSDHPELTMHQPQTGNFSGKLFILENGRSFSGSAEFASIVKTNQRGIFIGEECGGAYDGNTSGSENMVVLPYSGISVRIPLVKYTMATKPINPNDRGVIPDFIYYPNISDIAGVGDDQLSYALKVAEKN